MNQIETGEAFEAAHRDSDLRNKLANVLRQQAAISEALRAIAYSPLDLQPIFKTITAQAAIAMEITRRERSCVSCMWSWHAAIVSPPWNS